MQPASLPLAALHASHAGTWLRPASGETSAVSKGEAIMAAADTPLLMINAPLVATRLGYPDLSGLDLLELFAFVHPARFCVPTARGLAQALDLPEPESDGDIPAFLQRAGGALVAQCEEPDWFERAGAWSALQSLERLRWPFAQVLKPHVKRPVRAEKWLFASLPEWEEAGERAPPRQIELAEEEVLARLRELTGEGAEEREGQRDYARDAARIFAPRGKRELPHVALAEAGTGIGKTLGYLAPASLWAAHAGGTVWVSTFTKNLQRQLRAESRRAWPAKRPDGTPPVVVRKGRENYLCLLNLEDALQGGFAGRPAVLAQLVARWASYTRDGDMIGGDLPGWLGTLFRKRGIAALTDRRGECIYAGCPHYRKCFIERAARDSAKADLVIANHALVMVNAARGSDHAPKHAGRPTRVIFDEGHHVFEAADATFAATLSGQEAIELRRWIMGPERTSRGRRRGLAARLADVASHDKAGGEAIEAAIEAAAALPGDGWLQRLIEGEPSGEIERLLAAVRAITYARDESGQEAGYGIETEASGLPGEVIEAAGEAARALAAIRVPLLRLGARLEAVIADPPDWLDTPGERGGRARIEGARFALAWRIDLIAAWEALLARLGGPADPEFVDWLAVDRSDAREFDVAIHRRWLDPMKPFARAVLEPAHGVMLTSATLTDRVEDRDAAWAAAIERSGAAHIEAAPLLTSAKSPFDYGACAEVLIVTDIKRGDLPALAGAYARLIEASEGGVLGLFTAIRRLRAVHGRIADRLARAGLPLYAQHVDPIDTGTLVDIFRDDPRASLIGTDALRDGVDVPGRSLRCVVLEAVPWPRPDILHKARRAAAVQAGARGGQYDDRIIRARLAQGFGRLIRGRGDRGHFVVLSPAFPSRLLTAFPQGTAIRRLTLDEALVRVSEGLIGGPGAAANAGTDDGVSHMGAGTGAGTGAGAADSAP